MAAPVIAVIGGGQLARMMAPEAGRLGIHLRVLVEGEDAATAQVVPDSPVGRPADVDAVLRLVDGPPWADVLTFEHEHVPHEALAAVAARGVPVRPGPRALTHAQDKIVMRRDLAALGVPCPRWIEVAPDDPAALAEFIADAGGVAVVKTARGGYDGKGVRVVSSPDQVADWFADGSALLAEERVRFTRELAALVARSPSGELRAWPVVESIQVGGVCSEVIAPAPGLDPATAEEASRIAAQIASGLDVTGVLAVELFEVTDPGDGPRVLVNELAMRPHNSGHWTLDGAVTSQFEQHLRAVLDLPLGDPSPRAPWTVMANVLGSRLDDLTEALPEVFAAVPEARVNLYGKQVRPGRKLGHVNVTGTELTATRERARLAARILRGDDRKDDA